MGDGLHRTTLRLATLPQVSTEMRFIVLLTALIPRLCCAIETADIVELTRAHGYQSNALQLESEPYFSARKRIDEGATFAIEGFFADQTKQCIKQIRLSSSHCPGSLLTEPQFSEQTEAEMQQLFTSLSGTPLPVTVTGTPRSIDLKKEKIVVRGVRSIRTRKEKLYCDATPGGYGFMLDVFLENC